MTGSLLSSTSRMTPPAEPVIQPMMIATQKGCPKRRLFWMPAMVKRARPRVSKTNHAFFRGSIHLPKKTTVRSATAVHIANGDGDATDITAKPVEVFGSRMADTGNRKSEGSKQLNNIYDNILFHNHSHLTPRISPPSRPSCARGVSPRQENAVRARDARR